MVAIITGMVLTSLVVSVPQPAPIEITKNGITPDSARIVKQPVNEAAPVTPEEIQVDPQSFIEAYSRLAQKTADKYGHPASIKLAQAIIESRCGTSRLSQVANNHFGVKCFSARCKKGHCVNFTDDSHKDFFRKYASVQQSWVEHSRHITSGRYARLKRYGHDYKKWAYGLKSAGYATDRFYAEKLIGVIQRYKLYKYDTP